MDNDDGLSLPADNSSVSGFQNTVPICMVYVAHPIGAARTPLQQHTLTYGQQQQQRGAQTLTATTMATSSASMWADGGGEGQQQQHQHNYHHQIHTASVFTPWSEQSLPSSSGQWNRDCILPPLVQFLAAQIGHNVPDLETLIGSIREAWNSPNGRAALQQSRTPHSPDHLDHRNRLNHLSQQQHQQHQLHQHHHRQPGPATKPTATRADQQHLDHHYRNHYCPAPTTIDALHIAHHRHHHQLDYYREDTAGNGHNVANMGSGSNCTLAGPGLLRRRYSMPEIIMRKHSLAQQRSIDEAAEATAAAVAVATATNSAFSNNNSTPRTPTHRPPTPHRPPRNSTGQQYPADYNSNHSLGYAASASSHPSSPSHRQPAHLQPHQPLQHHPSLNCDTSMRRQLLRRIWSKEFRQASDSRSGSWSPPLRRSQRRLQAAGSGEPPARCAECTKLELEYASNTSLPTSAAAATAGAIDSPQKRVRLSSTASSTPSMDTVEDMDGTEAAPVSAKTAANSVDDNANNNIPAESIVNQPAIDAPDASAQFDDNRTEPLSQRTDANSNLLVESEDSTPATADESHAARVDQYIAKLLMDSLNNVYASDPAEPSTSAQTAASHYTEMTTMFVTNIDHPESVIYFPRYSQDSKEQSVYSSEQGDDPSLGLPSYPTAEHEEIAVQSGSTYPQSISHSTCVSRTMMPRTESMEVQRPSASPCDAGAESDDNSLVDSLDDPQSPRPDAAQQQPVTYEKSQTFFVSMQDASADDSMRADGAPESAATDEKLRDVSAAMPEKLRARMQRRLQLMDAKWQQQQQQPLRQPSWQTKRVSKRARKPTESETTETTPASVPAKSSGPSDVSAKAQPPNASASQPGASQKPQKTKKYIRAEVGLLETYTIDARGNMQFQEPAKKSQKSNSNGPSSKRIVATSASVSLPAKKSVSKSRKAIVVDGAIKRAVPLQPKKMATGQSATNGAITAMNSRRRADVQHMTVYAPSELMTPDAECGPRRMYQKTEIVDGTKRIEILEIVECADDTSSSPEDSGHQDDFRIRSSQALPRRVSPPHRAAATGSSRRGSRIPVPIFRVGTPCGFQKSVRSGCGTRYDANAGRIFVKNIQQAAAGSSRVDRMIADLLIEALNHPKELGIEFVQSPRGPRTPRGFRKVPASWSTTSAAPAVTVSRSAPGTGSAASSKYQQVFDVIPEEKSQTNSVSVDSSTDDKGAEPQVASEQPAKPAQQPEPEQASISSGDSAKSVTRGKEAVVSADSGGGPVEAGWRGFFQQHDEDAETAVGMQLVAQAAAAAAATTVTAVQEDSNSAKVQVPEAPPTSPAAATQSSEPDNYLALVPITPSTTTSPAPSASIPSPISVRFARTVQHSDQVHLDHRHCEQCRLIDAELMSTRPDRVQMPPRSILSSAASSTGSTIWPALGGQSVASTPQGLGGVSVKPALSPIESVSQKSTSSEIDSTSFIVLRDEDVARESKERADEQGMVDAAEPVTEAAVPPKPNTAQKLKETVPPLQSPQARCDDCCFCNPDLHKRSSSISRNCSYCNRKRNPQQPANESTASPRAEHRRSQSMDQKSGEGNFYETLSKTDHTHVRTRSKQTDTISMHCTRTNSKIRRFVPAPSASSMATDYPAPATGYGGDGFDDPEASNNPSSRRQHPKFRFPAPPAAPSTQGGSSAGASGRQGSPRPQHPAHKYRSAPVRLPSPFVPSPNSSTSSSQLGQPDCGGGGGSSNSSTASAGSSAGNSQCSSSLSSAPSSPAKQRCPVLPAVARWQNGQSHGRHHQHQNGGQPKATNVPGVTRPSRYQKFYGAEAAMDGRRGAVEESGWSLTLAGTYREDMAPDVEMRLSFPKKQPTSPLAAIVPPHKQRNNQLRMLDKDRTNHNNNNNNNNNTNSCNNYNNNYDRCGPAGFEDSDQHCTDTLSVNENSQLGVGKVTDKPQLPMNPKRTLMASKANTARPNRSDCNLPDVNSFVADAAARNGTRNSIKRSEYSVAVASATTKTISQSNFGAGKRAMSYQTLNANSIRIDNHLHHHHHSNHRLHHQHQHPHHRQQQQQLLHRDHSIDLG